LKSKPAAVGGSYGGYLTLMALMIHPDDWAGGVAIAPPTDYVDEYYATMLTIGPGARTFSVGRRRRRRNSIETVPDYSFGQVEGERPHNRRRERFHRNSKPGQKVLQKKLRRRIVLLNYLWLKMRVTALSRA